jgi:hypothetical protein
MLAAVRRSALGITPGSSPPVPWRRPRSTWAVNGLPAGALPEPGIGVTSEREMTKLFADTIERAAPGQPPLNAIPPAA